jgi:hypothetical protein
VRTTGPGAERSAFDGDRTPTEAKLAELAVEIPVPAGA